MSVAAPQRTAKTPRGIAAASSRKAETDWGAWQRFLLALFGLGFALLLAFEATALRESGRNGLAIMSAVGALALAAVVAVGTVPYLARRTALGRLVLRLEYEPTPAGLIYLLVLLALSLGAVNTGNNLLYLMLASLLAGLIVSGVVSRLVLEAVEVDLALPEHVFAERTVTARITFRNQKRFSPSFAVTLMTQRARRRRGEPSRNRTILGEPVYWPHVPHRSSRVQHMDLTFPVRGRYSQPGFRLATRFPFGLLVKARSVPLWQEVIVLPAIEPTEEFYEVLPLVSGEVESLAKGRGHDLYAIRDYRPGDPARHVDWKATARAQQLKVREFAREDERRVVLVLDARLALGDAPELARFEKAVNLCACLAWHFSELGAEMQFVTQGVETRLGRGREVLYQTLESLALVEPLVDAGLDHGLRAGGGLLDRIPAAGLGFHIILTSQPRGSIPTGLWSSSYVVFFDSLGETK